MHIRQVWRGVFPLERPKCQERQYAIRLFILPQTDMAILSTLAKHQTVIPALTLHPTLDCCCPSIILRSHKAQEWWAPSFQLPDRGLSHASLKGAVETSEEMKGYYYYFSHV